MDVHKKCSFPFMFDKVKMDVQAEIMESFNEQYKQFGMQIIKRGTTNYELICKPELLPALNKRLSRGGGRKRKDVDPQLLRSDRDNKLSVKEICTKYDISPSTYHRLTR